MTLPELKATYYAARRAIIERHASQRKTQTQAARDLGVTLTALNNIIHREGIYWPVIKQGPRNDTV